MSRLAGYGVGELLKGNKISLTLHVKGKKKSTKMTEKGKLFNVKVSNKMNKHAHCLK